MRIVDAEIINGKGGTYGRVNLDSTLCRMY